MIACSLSEIEVYARRAARGAGMSWGLAEEAGKACRWLAERGLPGVEMLVRLLTINDGRAYADMTPVINDGHWRAGAGALCPLCCGAALSDRIDALEHGEAIHLGAVACPLLLVPFVARSWRLQDAGCELRWSDVRVSISADGVAIESGDDSALMVGHAEEIELTRTEGVNTQFTHDARVASVETPRSAWNAMDALAKRTYVPASEESRARGAGAGRIDND